MTVRPLKLWMRSSADSPAGLPASLSRASIRSAIGSPATRATTFLIGRIDRRQIEVGLAVAVGVRRRQFRVGKRRRGAAEHVEQPWRPSGV